tara:strand:- start:36 stop:227 length:192 start_codon:yes stop_codon:yes gene_type:complete
MREICETQNLNVDVDATLYAFSLEIGSCDGIGTTFCLIAGGAGAGAGTSCILYSRPGIYRGGT